MTSTLKRKLNVILQQMVSIERMERGKLCAMQGGRYHNLQSWEAGRNVVRYVRATEIESVQQAIKGHEKFMALAHQYADLVIEHTRKKQESTKKALKKNANQ